MKQLLIIAFACILLQSCSHHSTTDTDHQKIPAALQEPKIFSSNEVSSIYTRDNDLVLSLYKEQVDSTPALQQLEKEIAALQQERIDSTTTFSDYDSKSFQYYMIASSHLSAIKDTILRSKIKSVLAASETRYKTHIAQHSAVLDYISTSGATLQDLHNTLRILTSLSMMEKYQHSNLPSLYPMKNFAAQQNAVISKTQALTPKH